MKILELTLDDPIANIALDEALLEEAELGQLGDEILRIWEPKSPIVVLGRSSEAKREANLKVCESRNIPVIRRCSGGAAILTAPGCLMYAVVLSYDKRPELRMLDAAHKFVADNLQSALLSCRVPTNYIGTCDLAIGDKKVSGNSMRCKRDWMLYHGTLICENMDLDLIASCLGMPKRQPDYRSGRGHREFLTRIPTTTAQLAREVRSVWGPVEALTDWPIDKTSELVEQKYSRIDWNHRV